MPIGFFTHGVEYTLPHPQIPQRTILLIFKVIRRAWHLLEEKPVSGFHMQSADEDTITHLLVEIIENSLRKSGEIDGFNYALFGKVSRDSKITNFNKKHPDKMPDIVFGLRRERLPIISDQDGFFVECKPIDIDHPILSHYCNKGLIRFVNGDYVSEDGLELTHCIKKGGQVPSGLSPNNLKERYPYDHPGKARTR